MVKRRIHTTWEANGSFTGDSCDCEDNNKK